MVTTYLPIGTLPP